MTTRLSSTAREALARDKAVSLALAHQAQIDWSRRGFDAVAPSARDRPEIRTERERADRARWAHLLPTFQLKPCGGVS